ncbi:MAG TPA: response regulator, partial [Gemmatimonadales bacterium]|nr:response regulator [Gemmatimonadales bacterium]
MAMEQSPHRGAQRVLVVDDNDAVRAVLRRTLESRDHRVQEADSADAALVAVAENPSIDLVISDIRMPRHDGIWLLSELGRRYPDVGVLMISGNGDLDTAVKCLQARALDFLSKPVVP